jgi:Family of unknown function (DUF5343)
VKVNSSLLKSWGLNDTNALSIVRVLKTIGLVGAAGEPSDEYIEFMDPKAGASTLGRAVQRVYAPLFEATHKPYNESDPDLRRLFNVHSGGSSLNHQIATFKVLCEFSKFDQAEAVGSSAAFTAAASLSSQSSTPSQSIGPSLHIDLHIHLPENRSSREYQNIIEDIARYIYRHEMAEE